MPDCGCNPKPAYGIHPDCPLENAEDYVPRWQAHIDSDGNYKFKDATDWEDRFEINFLGDWWDNPPDKTEINLWHGRTDTEDGTDWEKRFENKSGQELLAEKLPYYFKGSE